MMSRFREAESLNNDGVTALVNGDISTANESLSQAVKLMRQEVATTEMSSFRQGRVESGISGTSTTEISPHIMEGISSSETIIFNHAIWLPDHSVLEYPSPFDMNIYAGAVIYNLALAHHFNISTCSASLEKAEKLYCLLLQLMDDNALYAHTALIVKLACINNLYQIHYLRGGDVSSRYERAKEGLDHVCSFMTRRRNASSLNHDVLDNDPDVQSLLVNVLLLKRFPQGAAAA